MPTLREHVIMDHVDEVRKLVNKRNINQKAGPWTLLHETVFSDLPRMAECLCACGADVNAKGGDDETPLHSAATRHRIEVARVLLAYGANTYAKDINGKSPLDWAKSEKDEEMVVLFQNPPARKTPDPSSAKGEKTGGLFGFLSRLFAGEDRSNWTLQQYAQAIANKVTNRTPCEDSGLEAHRNYIRTLGQEINDKFGFEGMQQAWEAIHHAMGPGPCSDLTRIWDRVGRWQK